MQPVINVLFASPLMQISIDQNMEALKETVKRTQWEENGANGSLKVSITKNLQILNSFPQEKKLFNQCFTQFLTETVHYSHIPFQMTTSWGTKIESGGFGQRHDHKNCLYSGVFYFDDVDEGGEIMFSRPLVERGTIWLGDPSYWNIFNSTIFKVSPKKNSLIIFPSSLEHSVLTYTGTETRYSLAMNWAPEGLLGGADSQINWTLHDIT